MLEMIAAMPGHLEEGILIGRQAELKGLEQETFQNIILTGMGGSAIGGDIIRSCLGDELRIPMAVNRNYRLPGYIGKKTLVVCSSYSGNTEETIAAFHDAVKRGAKILVITTGGTLGELARENGIPLVKIKPGLPPRAALGYSVAPLLLIFFRLGLCRSFEEDLGETIIAMKRGVQKYAPTAETNPAWELARKLKDKLIIIYSGYERIEAVALRMKGQICENAKLPAYVNQFPELNHNELVGWQKPNLEYGKFAAVILKDRDDHKRTAAGAEIVSRYLADKGIEITGMQSEGESQLERMFSLIQAADFTSYYLALLNEVDPYPVGPIDYLKENLKKIN